MSIIVLIGRSGSGKSSIQKCLEENGYEKVVMSTTRPKRDGEIEGVDYYFLSNEEWGLKVKEGRLADIAYYNDWGYGLEIPENKDNLVICSTPAGMRSLKRSGYDIISVYINVDQRVALIRSLERGDSIVEACRRSISDLGQFDRVSEEVDIEVKNDFKKSLDEIVQEILNKISEL